MCYNRNIIMKKLTNFLLALLIALGVSYTGITLVNTWATTLKVVQSQPVYLYSGLSASATSMRITPYPRDLNGVKLTLSDLGDNSTVTVDPGLKNIEEIIMVSNLIDNGDNTATLAISGRNLTSKYPYTTTGTGRQHGSGAIVVFSNNPQIYGRLAAIENAMSISGLWTYVTSPVVPTPTLGTQAVNKAYVDGGILAGAATSTESVTGIVRLATALQAASSTATTANTPLVLQAQNATSTYGATSGLKAVITQNDGKIDSNFIRQSDNFAWTGANTNSGTNLFTASSTFNATTTIGASSVTNNALVLNGLAYKMPSTRGASSTVLMEDGTGNLTSQSVFENYYLGTSNCSGTAGGSSSECWTGGNTQARMFVVSLSESVSGIGTETKQVTLFKNGMNSMTISDTFPTGEQLNMLAAVSATSSIQVQCSLPTAAPYLASCTGTVYFYR